MRKWVARINAFLQENLDGHVGGAALPARGAQPRRPSRRSTASTPTPTCTRSSTTRSSTRRSSCWPRSPSPSSCCTADARCSPAALTLGALVAFIQYSERFWRPISDLSEKFNILQAAMASSERIFVLLDTQPSRSTPDPAVRPAEVQGRVASRTSGSPTRDEGAAWVLQDIDFTVEPGQERRPGGRHRRGQDLDHQPADPLLRRAAGPGHPRRGGRARPRSQRAALVARPRAAGRPPVQRHHRLQHPPGLGHLRRARARRGAGRCTPTASSRRCPRATTPR